MMRGTAIHLAPVYSRPFAISMCPSLSPAPFLCPRVPPALCARAFSSPQTRGPRAPKPLCAPRASRRRRPPFYCFWATHTHSAGRRRRALALPSPQQKKDRPVREPPGPRQQPSLARRRAPARRAYHQAISSSWFATLLLPPPSLLRPSLSLSLLAAKGSRAARPPPRRPSAALARPPNLSAPSKCPLPLSARAPSAALRGGQPQGGPALPPSVPLSPRASARRGPAAAALFSLAGCCPARRRPPARPAARPAVNGRAPPLPAAPLRAKTTPLSLPLWPPTLSFLPARIGRWWLLLNIPILSYPPTPPLFLSSGTLWSGLSGQPAPPNPCLPLFHPPPPPRLFHIFLPSSCCARQGPGAPPLANGAQQQPIRRLASLCMHAACC